MLSMNDTEDSVTFCTHNKCAMQRNRCQIVGLFYPVYTEFQFSP